jgi:hypothetical protein
MMTGRKYSMRMCLKAGIAAALLAGAMLSAIVPPTTSVTSAIDYAPHYSTEIDVADAK